MLGRMVLKLMFKACVPLVAVAGVATYGVYLRGGDPGAIWKHVAGGAVDQASSMFSNARAGASSTVKGVSGKLVDGDSGSQSTEVFMWKDAAGVTHYSNSQPSGVNTESLLIDPNVNVLTPVVAPAPRYSEAEQSLGSVRSQTRAAGTQPLGSGGERQTSDFNRRTGESVRNLEAELGEPLPGVAGQVLSGQNGAGGMDPSQLIKLLQGMQ